ncbi:peptidoglycan DD-metalloendopeptidase family protein [Algoriphagus sp. AGSA1]|nr:peptidoglycan DD-metalloendopeptidase family protein [Algoriphagus sp. AGSA1]
MKREKNNLLLIACICLFICSCNNQSLRIFKSKSARAQYLNTLESSGISKTKIGAVWQISAQEALVNAVELEVPIAIQGSFKAKSITAEAWKIRLEEGASVKIFIHWQASDSSRLIVDLLEGSEWKELQSVSTQNDSLKFEAEKTGNYLLRIQPELMGEGNFQIRVNGTATYAVFPVHGKTSRAIQSFWGDPRDGGRRSHEGVDVFAARGTPVLSPVEGVVTSVRDRGLGGKQVWVRDSKRNWNLYFAHLDSQLVNNLQRVQAGDTLGLVGNTGNARTTAPHLHFGIYSGGAINPLPALRDHFELAPVLEEKELPELMKVSSSQANLRSQPSTKSLVIARLKSPTPVFVKAATSDWYQVRTAEGTVGFLYQNLVAPVDSTAIGENLTYAITAASSPTDSVLVNLQEFRQIGITAEGYGLIVDKDGNIYYHVD